MEVNILLKNLFLAKLLFKYLFLSVLIYIINSYTAITPHLTLDRGSTSSASARRREGDMFESRADTAP